MKRKWDATNEQLQRKCIDEIIARVDDIGDAGAGVIAAQDIIDIVLENLGPEIYNNGVADAKKVLETKLNDMLIEIDLLKQSS